MLSHITIKLELLLGRGVDEWSDQLKEAPDKPRNCTTLDLKHSFVDNYSLFIIKARPKRSG